MADEPTGNLDEQTRDDIISLLEGLWRDEQLTLVPVTHDSAVARRAPHVVALNRGRLEVRRAKGTTHR